MSQQKQSIQQIINDIKNRKYQLKKVEGEERNLPRRKKIKTLIKKVQKLKGESTKERMLAFFELGRELDNKYSKEGKKYEKTLA